MVARWHLDLALLTLGTGMVLLGADRLVRPVVRRHVLAFAGLTAAVLGTRANPPLTDLHRLRRSPVQASDSARWFRRKAVGGMHLEDDLRQLANRVRYRGATR